MSNTIRKTRTAVSYLRVSGRGQIEGDGFRSLKDGENVEYELIEGDKGWQARTVHRLESAPS